MCPPELGFFRCRPPPRAEGLMVMKKRRVFAGVISTVVMVGAAFLVAPPGSAERVQDPTVLSDTYPEGVTRQSAEDSERADNYIAQVRSKYGDDIDVIIEGERRALVLVVSEKRFAEVTVLSGTRVGGLSVVVVRGTFTPAVLDGSLEAIGAEQFQGKELIESISTTDHGNAIRVRIHGLSRIDQSGTAKLQAKLEELAGGAVQLAPALEFRNMSRTNDSDPWFGGGWMVHPAGAPGLVDDSLCSVGFAVLKGSAGRLLSAGHCIRDEGTDTGTPHPTWDWRDGTRADLLSSASTEYSSGVLLDSLLIDPTGGTSVQVHGGPWNATSSSTSRYHLSVNNPDSNVEGQRVCTSGANSGEHCQLEIVAHNHVPCSLGWCHRWIAQSPTGGVAAASGDSGGPVYKQLANPDRVEARGIIRLARA